MLATGAIFAAHVDFKSVGTAESTEQADADYGMTKDGTDGHDGGSPWVNGERVFACDRQLNLRWIKRGTGRSAALKTQRRCRFQARRVCASHFEIMEREGT
ncbi:hypothetical protein JCM19000A_39210 [Silvimonas sp. JCM 19000]